MAESQLRWLSFDRVIVTRGTAKLTAADLDALAAAIASVASRVGKRLLLVQVGSTSGGVSVHAVGRAGATPFARYASAVRAHVEEVHAIAPGGGAVGGALRGLVSFVTRFGPNPSLLHPDADALVESLRRRHGIDPVALRDCIARV